VPRISHAWQLILIVTVTLVGACATTTLPQSSVIKTLRNIEGTAPFGNVLVVSAAGDRASRALFEQEMAAAITSDTTVATALFAVVGRYSPISRNILNNAVSVREFDAILLVRRQGQDRPDQVSNRPTGTKFDLFRYDYDELNDLTGLDAASTFSFVTEFYATDSEEKIWAMESLVYEPESVTAGMSQQVAIIAAELQEDRLVGR